MGKVGRFACIFTPMALTIASLLLLIIVGVGSTNKNDDNLNNLYFMRANTSNIQQNASEVNLPDNVLAIAGVNLTSTANTTTDVKDFYHIGLWNYCSGSFKNNDVHFDNKEASKTDDVTTCTKRTSQFWFDPVEVWGLNQTEADVLFSKELRDGLKAYKTVAKWMYIAYIVAVVSTGVEIIIGFFALFSRWGSVATTVVSAVSSTFIMAFGLTATILYATLVGTFNHALKKYNIHGVMGYNIYVLLWLAVLFSWAAGLFWLFSSCCCSGRSDRIKGYNDKRNHSHNYAKGGKANFGPETQHAPYQYERVQSPFLGLSGNNNHHQSTPAPSYHQQASLQPQFQHGPQSQPATGKNTAYEPFRHEET